ncbi:MAG: YraN family protein [Candidatus Cloacimonetes bacterium]|nr:YraN family protein [Candidatus Cloacimonadota bacterium]
MSKSQDLGRWGEDIALEYLTSLGARLVQRNFLKRGGEIDLILYHQDNLVFVEVRTRTSNQFMDPIQSINSKKKNKIKRTAQHFYSYIWKEESICRFDVVCITGDASNYELEHIEDAFT